MRTLRLIALAAAVTATTLAPARSWGDPPPSSVALDATAREDLEEEALADGDIDAEDRATMRVSGRPGATDLRGESWISLVGLRRELLTGKSDLGAMVIVGLALDRLATGPVHHIADGADPVPPAPVPVPTPPPDPRSFPPTLAHDCVVAAWRSSGLGVDDSRIDEIVSRARASAALPETRLRAMRLWDDANHTTTLATTDTSNYYDAVGANLVLELRLTWRLDRLVYAGDEPTLERVRLERQDARARLASRALEALFAWKRAELAGREAAAGSREELEADLRIAETQATLDVLTAGWFSAWLRAGGS